MRSLSNLYKAHINQKKNDYYTRVIDYNDLLEQKLSALSFEQEQKLRRQRMKQAKADAGDAQDETGDVQTQEALENEFQEGLFAPTPELEIDYVEQAKEQAAQIVADATKDAEEILKKAVEEAEKLKEQAMQQGTQQGYSEGMEQAHAKEEQMRLEFEQMCVDQEEEYAKKLEQMEPLLMDAVVDVLDHVLQSDLAKRKEILLHLVRRTVQNIKDSQKFQIRVSSQDYPYVSEHKNEIIQKIGSSALLDIVQDESLRQGQCTIDTDEGIFECGLDVQFENLVKELKMLSCMDESGYLQ